MATALLRVLYGSDAQVLAFFHNDPRGCALRDARWFAAACRRAGLPVSRTPAADEVRVAPAQ